MTQCLENQHHERKKRSKTKKKITKVNATKRKNVWKVIYRRRRRRKDKKICCKSENVCKATFRTTAGATSPEGRLLSAEHFRNFFPGENKRQYISNGHTFMLTWHNDADLVGNRRFFIRDDRIPWSMTPHCKAELFSNFRAKRLNKIFIEKPDIKGLKRFENISPKEFTCLSFIAFFREFQQNSRIAT